MSRLILVLGCHRSGTSLIARSLECLGVQFGVRANWSGPDNPDFCEDQDVLGLNDSILTGLGLSWDAPVITLPRAGLPVMGAAWLLEEKLALHPLFGLKEPRMCRMLPFWRQVCAATGTDVAIVEAVRHPGAVARSLETRNGIPALRGLSLWTDHVRRLHADRDLRWPIVTVLYENMLRHPGRELLRIAGALHLHEHSAAVARFAAERVIAGLNHHDGEADLPIDVAREWAMAQQRGSL